MNDDTLAALKKKCEDTAADLGHELIDWRNMEDEGRPASLYTLCLHCGLTIQIVALDPPEVGGGAITLECE